MSGRRMFWNIVDKIEASIAAGDYPAGSRLPPERELAERFDVSRPTIREAIIALEVRGRVEVKTGSGVYLLDMAPEEKHHNVNAFELTQARALIEGEVAAIAASNISDEELEQLEGTLKQMEQGGDVEQADELFHHIIAESTRNNAMLQSVESLWGLRRKTKTIVEDYDMVCSSDALKVLEEHRAIYEALKSRDPNAARNAMHKHFNRLINALFDAEETRALEEIRRKNSEKRGKYSLEHVVKSSSGTR